MINKYGIGEFACRLEHIIISDIDKLPHECKNCNIDSKQASHDSMIWGNILENTNIENLLENTNIENTDYIIHPLENNHIKNALNKSKYISINKL